MRKILAFLIMTTLLVGSNSNVMAKKVSINNNRVIVKLKNKYSNSFNKKLEKTLKVKVKKVEKLKTNNNTYVIYTGSKISDIQNKVNLLNRNDEIVKVQPSFKYEMDDFNSKKTRAIADNWHIIQSKSDRMKAQVNDANKVSVGVISTGVDSKHPSLANIIDEKLSYNFSSNDSNYNDNVGHGTYAAGLIGAKNQFSAGKNISVLAFRVQGSTEEIANAVAHAQKNNVKILNIPFFITYYDTFVFEAIDKYDGLVIRAAGDSNIIGIEEFDDRTYDKSLDYQPYRNDLELDNIITVGAISKNISKLDTSNDNKKAVDIFAPGESVYSTCSAKLPFCFVMNGGMNQHDENEIVSSLSGTSASSSIVSGVAGTIYSQNSKMSMRQLKNAIMDGAIAKDTLKNFSVTEGYLDAEKALKYSKVNKTNATHQAKLNNDGSISLWGNNEEGQLGNNTTNALSEANAFNYQIPQDKIVKYYLTKNNTYLVSAKGDLYVTGKNDYNQLNQNNTNNSTKFVKFNKISNSHIVTDLEFRNSNNLYDEGSLIINLKTSAGLEQYYKLGNDSFKIDSILVGKTNNLQHVVKKYGKKYKISYYQALSNKLSAFEQFNYESIDAECDMISSCYSYALRSKVMKTYYSNYIIEKRSDYDFDDNYKVDGTLEREKSQRKNYKGIYLSGEVKYYDVSLPYYDEDNLVYINKKSLIRNEQNEYKNGKLSKIKIKNYNYNAQLKSNKYGYAYYQTNTYNAQKKLISIHKVNYNANGKLGKMNLIYRATYRKSGSEIKKYSYNDAMQKLKYQKTIFNKKNKAIKYQVVSYNKKYKVAYLNRLLKNGIKTKEYYYKYNNKGQLKKNGKSSARVDIRTYKNGKLSKVYRYTYNKKGKKVNKKIIYSKGGKK